MKQKLSSLLTIICMVSAASVCAHAAPSPLPLSPSLPASERPVQDFPLGVYWGWDHNLASARVAKLEKWAFIKRTCTMLSKNGIDTIWIVNIDLADLKALLKITRPLGLKILPNLVEIEAHGLAGSGIQPEDPNYVERALEYYRTTVPRVVSEIGEDRAGILAWVISDEPNIKMLKLIDPVRQIFAAADPERPATLVSNWVVTPSVIENTRLSTVCIDVYPFFGPNSPSGPHTPEASQNYFSSCIFNTVAQAAKEGRTAWAMPQCYAEIFGPFKRREDGAAVAAAGSFISWRMPTNGEMRWQVWESLRAGAKGVIFFTILTSYQAEYIPKPTDPVLEPALLKEATVVGELAALSNKGMPTPQFNVMAQTFRALRPYKALIRRLKPSSSGWLSAGKGAQVSNFIDPDTQTEYAVVVNPDTQNAQRVSVIVAAKPGVLKPEISNVLSGALLKLEEMGWVGGNFRISIALQAGEGVLLKLKPS